jgi:hypothetical protein
VARKAYLASIVPVIVNAILNDHQIVVDIVAFVNKGDFPRSRLGEKQRGKILASWVTRKMRTMAQFGIRDADSALSDVIEGMEPHSGAGSVRNGSVMANSFRNSNSEITPQQTRNSFVPLPTGISELPDQRISELPDQNYNDSPDSLTHRSDDTPTDNRTGDFDLPTLDYDAEKSELPADESNTMPPAVSPPRVGPKPTSPQSPLPAVEGREGDLWTLPSQAQSGGLRVQNSGSGDEDEEDDAWKNDAIMHMNLAGRTT